MNAFLDGLVKAATWLAVSIGVAAAVAFVAWVDKLRVCI